MSQNENLNAQRAWNANAEFWNQRMAEGNDFFNLLIWPAVAMMLQPIAGEPLLDVACGNGVTSRRLALKALASLLRPNGRFVFSVVHPCFNNPSSVQMGELEDRAGMLVTTYSVKISRYLTPYTQDGLAMPGQPMPHPYFHRPLGALLAPAFPAGFVLDALEERTFPTDYAGGSTPLSWNGHFSEIPPVMVGRMRIKTG